MVKYRTKTEDEVKKESMTMTFLRLVGLKIELIKIQRTTNLLCFYSITFVLILFVAEFYILN